MKFGLFYLPTHVPQARDVAAHFDDIVEQVLFADAIGIDYVWMVEHHFVRHGGLCAGTYPFLAYLAGKTKRIRLGTGATVLPLNDAVRVAEMAATLDQLSQGRFDLGVGRGFLRDEFDTFGVPMSEARARVEDGVNLIKRAWTEPTLSYDGPFRPRIDGLTILPRVYQKPHPPIWNACFLTQESFVWTAAQGYNLLYVAYHVDSVTAGERVHWYIDALPGHGRRIEDHEVCCCYHAHFTAAEDAAGLRALVEGPMAEYTGAGVEAATQAARPRRLQELCRARGLSAPGDVRDLFSRPRPHGLARARARAHRLSARARHDPARPHRRFRLARAGRYHAVARGLRARHPAQGARALTARYSAAPRVTCSSSGFFTLCAPCPAPRDRRRI